MPIVSCFPSRIENDDRYLRLIGGTMAGNIAMGGHKVTGLGAPTNPSDAVRQQDLAALSNEIDDVISGNTPVAIPYATESKAGVVKIGDGLDIDADGIAYVTYDTVPTEGSDKLVQSGGVYSSLSNKQDKLSGAKGQLVGFDDDGNAVAQTAPDTGVVTFNGRNGAVSPLAGDYTADMVGARPDTWMPSAGDVGAIPSTEKGAASGVATLGADGKVPAGQLPQMDYIPTSMKGANSGVAELDENGKVPSAQLPSYVDDVLEYTNKSSFPETGEAGKIYVALDTNLTYRWGGTEYVEISSSLALGETESTAYRGDRGATAYAHSQITQGNPHGTTAADVGARPDTWTPSAEEVGARPDTWTPSAADVGAVPVGRTVNGHALNENISLTADDVGARASDWMPTATDVGARPATWTPTASDVGALPSGTTLAQLPDDASHRTVSDTEKSTWNAKAERPEYIAITLESTGWSENTQTVTAPGVLADETKQLIQPTPAISSQSAYINAGVICSNQGANQLTFSCATQPSTDISLYVVITEIGASN